jgi:hypothetical protein
MTTTTTLLNIAVLFVSLNALVISLITLMLILLRIGNRPRFTRKRISHKKKDAE